MNNLKFYYVVEFQPMVDSKFPGLDLSKDFPGLTQAVAGSPEFATYDLCTAAGVNFLKQKLALLNVEEESHKIFFEKNQFDYSLTEIGKWEENEVVKIYIAGSKESVYNSVFLLRVFFTNPISENSFYIEAPSTLQ